MSLRKSFHATARADRRLDPDRQLQHARDDARRAGSGLRRTRKAPFEVIVVDNASSDGSAAAIAAHPGKPKLIALDHNIGFGRGNNLAAEQATGEYLLLLNPDTVVKDRAIDRFWSFATRTRTLKSGVDARCSPTGASIRRHAGAA